MKTKNKILVALDLEDQSMIALKYAEYFAEVLDYELEVITVVEESSLFNKLFSSNEIIKEMDKGISERVNKAIEPFANKVRINTTIAHGKPWEKIVEHAEKLMPSVIFMGKSELPKYKRAFVGSNSMHVILESDFPVITIRGDYDFEKYKQEHKEILLPLDLEKNISEQVSAAVEFAKLLNAPLHLFSVERTGSKGQETKMISQLAQAKKVITDAGLKCTTELVVNEEDTVSDLISNEAEKRNASLIVIMTREENKLAGLFMGSNARDIISNSNIPVLSVEPWDSEEGSKIFSQFIDVLNIYKK